MGTWRLIRDGDGEAATNMAVDEAIMTARLDGKCSPTLRLYGWERPSISIGHFQDISRGGIDLEYCLDAGIDIVQRPTGGRAVLHGHDVTFSIVLSESDLPDDARNVIGSHSWLMSGILAGLRSLGIDARLGSPGGSSSQRSADCFAHAAACDIVAGTSKIAGSAQVRRHGAILEQGSIPFGHPAIEPSRVYGRQMDVGGDLLPGISRQSLEDALIEGFRSSHGIEFTEEKLSPGEVIAAEALCSGHREATPRVR